MTHPSYDRRAPRRRGCGCFGALVTLVVVLVVLTVAGEFVLRSVAADRVAKEAAAAIGAPVDVDFGTDPLLPALVTREVGTLHLTSPGAGSVPALDLTARDTAVTVPPSGRPLDEATAVVGDVTGTATVADVQLGRIAGEAGGDGPLGGLTRVRSVRSDPASGTLVVGLAAGVEVGVVPSVRDNTLSFEPVTAEVAGVRIPSGLVKGLSSAVQSQLDTLPEGLVADGVRVVDGGLEVHLTGHGVPLQR